MDLKEFERFNKVIYEKTGIHIPLKKKILLENKLDKLVHFSNYKNLEDFYNELVLGTEKSLHELINYITTNYSFFFREKVHFEFLVKNIKERKVSTPYIWCAASSTGEEVYSIIIYLLENNIRDFVLVASDIDKTVLLKLNNGFYDADKLTNVSSSLLKKYFIKEKSQVAVYRVKQALRKKIKIKRLNLIDDLTFEAKFDYIFCRNVLIYFDTAAREKVLKTLLKNLNKEGLLFLSLSENIISMDLPIKQVASSVYMKKV